MKLPSSRLRLWCRSIHRELSYFFAGAVLVYAVSGLVMNHRDTIDPHYAVSRTSCTVEGLPAEAGCDRAAVERLMTEMGVAEGYTKHYFPKPGHLKVFLKGGSSLEADLASGEVVYESLRRRPLLSALTTLHYNPGRWWTWFADLFALCLIAITVTGLLLLKGPRGLRGRGGVEFAAGILLPLLLFLCAR